MTQRSPFRYFKTSPEIIRLAVMLYVQQPLSRRNVEDLLHERSTEISHKIVQVWWNRFISMFAAEIRLRRVDRMRSLPHWRWHLDEVYAKINCLTHYLWRAVGHEGEVLEALVTKRRDRKVALKSLRKTMKRHGRPHVFGTDKLRSDGAALKDLGLPEDRETGRWPNNRAESSLRGPSVHISRFDDGNVPCSAFVGRDRSRSSSRFIPQSTTTSTESAPSPAETISRPAAPPFSRSGAISALHKGQFPCPT